MQTLKLAIINGEQDLLRITPIDNGNTIDFKISTLGNDYALNYWSLGLEKPECYHTNDEITYHSSKMDGDRLLRGTVHVKNPIRIDYRYSFPHVVDLRVDTEFPIPLLKLSIIKKCDRRYEPKKNHAVFNCMDKTNPKINTIEIYITSKEFGEAFLHKWPFFHLLWTVSTIDYLVKGPELSPQFIRALNNGSPADIATTYTGFDNFNIHTRYYYQNNVSENTLSFYENFDYISMLSSTRIQLIDGVTKVPLSKIHPAFIFDLKGQRDKGLPNPEIKKWSKIFRESLNRIDRLKIIRVGFHIPQYDE